MPESEPPSLYSDLKFPQLPDRPYFLTNFVQTLDGKVATSPLKSEYWPLGSRSDYLTLLNVRANADLLIHGKGTALGHPTLTTLRSPLFLERRQQAGKPALLPYAILSNHPDQALADHLASATPEEVCLVTTEMAELPEGLEEKVQILRLGKERVSLSDLATHWKGAGYQAALLEGGPHLLSHFVEAGLVDEVFVTIAPMFLTGGRETTISMLEGTLLAANHLPRFSLLSSETLGNEIFLRYQRA